MGNFKDKQAFEHMNARGDTPREAWKSVEGRRTSSAQAGVRAFCSRIQHALYLGAHQDDLDIAAISLSYHFGARANLYTFTPSPSRLRDD